MTLFLGGMMSVPTILLMGTADSLPSPLLIIIPGTICLAALAHLCFLVVSLPRYWTRQGVRLDERGIGLYREPMWWFRGDGAHIGWHDVHHIDGHLVARREHRPVTLVQIQLRRADHRTRLPPWARLLAAGEGKWGYTAANHPVLLIAPHHIGVRSGLLALLRARRSDLFPAQVALRELREHETRRRHGGPPRLPHPAHVPTAWIGMRAPRAGRWAIGAAILLCLWLTASGTIYSIFVEGADVSKVAAAVMLPVIAMPLSLGALWIMPRCFTRQGVSVDGTGLTLVQDSFLWFQGRTAHLPWTGIRVVREGRPILTGPRTLRVFLNHPDGVTVVPTWCLFDNRTVNEPPAGPHEPLTQVTVRPSHRQYVEVLRAVQAARPDLVLSM